MFMSCFWSLYQVLLNVATTIFGLRNARAIFEANTCHHAIISFAFNNFTFYSSKVLVPFIHHILPLLIKIDEIGIHRKEVLL